MFHTRVFFIVSVALLLRELGICAQTSETDPEMGIFLDNTIVCQGKQLKLKCHNSSLTLKIYSAMYGRTEPGDQICPYRDWDGDSEFYCGESDVTTRLQRICSRRTKCRIQVERAVFGRDFCPGKNLYLRVIYGCEYKKTKKHTSTKAPSQLTTTMTLNTSSLPKSTQKTPRSKFVNITTAAVTNTTEKPFPNNKVEMISKDSAVFTSSSRISVEPSKVNLTQPPGHQRTPVKSEPSVTPPAVIVQHSMRGSVGVWGSIVVCFLILQDHFTMMVLVFFGGVAAALLIVAIAAVIIFRWITARKNNQRLKVMEVPRLNTSPGPSPALEKSHAGATRVPCLIHAGTLPHNPTSDFYTEYSSPGNKEPTSSRNVVPRMVVRASSSKEIYKKDLNIDRIRCVHAKNDVTHEMHPLLVQKRDGLRMLPNPMYADRILPANEPHSQATS